MPTPSFKIEAHGTSSSLVPGTIQNSRNNNLEILTIIQTIPDAGETATNVDLLINLDDLADKEIVGSTAEISGATGVDVSIGTNTTDFDDLLAADTYLAGTTIVPLLANLSAPVTGAAIKVRSAGGATGFTLTLRLILRKP